MEAENFPGVPGDLVDALDRHFPPSMPLDPNILGLSEEGLRALFARVRGRRDVVEFLKNVRMGQTESRDPGTVMEA